jgi:phage regulator Rha-like protein
MGMNDLVRIQRDDVFTDSLIIARETGNRHKNVKELCLKYQNQFESLGTFSVLNGESIGGRPEEIYQLNEPQSSFLLTLMRNSPKVVDFKLRLVQEFYAMRKLLLEKQTAEWREARRQSKEIRLQETDAIQALVEYARRQGSQHADKLYLAYTKLVKGLAGYETRDAADVGMLLMILSFENILRGIILTEMALDTHYKAIYQKAKAQLLDLKRLWSTPRLTG